MIQSSFSRRLKDIFVTLLSGTSYLAEHVSEAARIGIDK